MTTLHEGLSYLLLGETLLNFFSFWVKETRPDRCGSSRQSSLLDCNLNTFPVDTFADSSDTVASPSRSFARFETSPLFWAPLAFLFCFSSFRIATARSTSPFSPSTPSASISLRQSPSVSPPASATMAPLVLHNVPDDELYTGADGIKRPFAVVGATDEYVGCPGNFFTISICWHRLTFRHLPLPPLSL